MLICFQYDHHKGGYHAKERGHILDPAITIHTFTQGGQLSVSHYREELAVIQALDSLLHPDEQASPQHVMEVQQSQVMT
jgi:hypothetical protein